MANKDRISELREKTMLKYISEKAFRDFLEAHLPQKSSVDENTSDWYHTFKELYEHRVALYIRLVNETIWKYKRHKSKIHNDWSEFEWWFILMWYIPEQVSYHLPNNVWDLVKCEIKEKADKWDWHTSADVVKHLNSEQVEQPK